MTSGQAVYPEYLSRAGGPWDPGENSNAFRSASICFIKFALTTALWAATADAVFDTGSEEESPNEKIFLYFWF